MNNFISRECSLYLLSNNSLEILKYQALSGIGFNKLGLYAECILDPDNQFYLMKADSDYCQPLNSIKHKFVSGICFNKICDADDLQYTISGSFSYLKTLPFSELKVVIPS